MKLVYKADDGTEFGTEAECKAHESNSKLRKFLNERIGVFTDINISDVEFLIQKHIDEIVRIVRGGTVVTSEAWISNEGNSSSHHPESLTPETEIEIKLRNGTTQQAPAKCWTLGWKSTDNDQWDIIAYRIVK